MGRRLHLFPIFLVFQMLSISMALSVNAGRGGQYVPEFPPCSPTSEPTLDLEHGLEDGSPSALPELEFCSKWNPEFVFNGHHCCGKGRPSPRKRRQVRCSVQRARGSYCGEITPEQEEYSRRAESGELGDVLELISREMKQRSSQAYCTVNNGFLAWGRRLVSSEENRISLRSPDRCTEFGTDAMIGMLEWMGRQVAKQYSTPDYKGTRLVIGDISAPRGGCLSGQGGRRGHLSHTTGQDVDIAFLMAKPGRTSSVSFHREFDAQENWKFLKQLFQNPFACIKVIFLDQKLIRKLSKVAQGDEEWRVYRRFIRHMPAHRNHFHVRIGEGPGLPGCTPDARPELEEEEGVDDLDFGLPDGTLGRSRLEVLLDGSGDSEEAAARRPAVSSQPSSSRTGNPGQSLRVEE